MRAVCEMRFPLLYFLLLLTQPSQAAETGPPPTVTIGVVAPLTGNAAHIGTQISRALRIVSDLAANRSMYTFRFVIEDGKAAEDSSPATAVRRLISIEGAYFLIAATSGEVMQAAPIAEREHALLIAVYASHKDVKHLGKYVFRIFPDLESGTGIVAAKMRADNALPAAILTEEHPFTAGARDLLLAALGADAAMPIDYPSNETDLRSILLRAKARSPKSYYFSCSHPRTCSAIVTQAAQLGISGLRYSFLHMDNPDFLQAAGEAASGLQYLGVPEPAASNSRYEAFLEAYSRRFGEKPSNDFLARTTIDAASVLIDAIAAAGTDPEKVRDHLSGAEFSGTLGKIKFDSNGDAVGLDYVMKKVK